jgi:hypothetical protein
MVGDLEQIRRTISAPFLGFECATCWPCCHRSFSLARKAWFLARGRRDNTYQAAREDYERAERDLKAACKKSKLEYRTYTAAAYIKAVREHNYDEAKRILEGITRQPSGGSDDATQAIYTDDTCTSTTTDNSLIGETFAGMFGRQCEDTHLTSTPTDEAAAFWRGILRQECQTDCPHRRTYPFPDPELGQLVDFF